MNYKNILKALAVGAIVYGVYKYGEKKGKETKEVSDEIEDINESENSDPIIEEKNYIMGIIDQINSKSIISKKDRDNLGLLEVKLKQMINKK